MSELWPVGLLFGYVFSCEFTRSEDFGEAYRIGSGPSSASNSMSAVSNFSNISSETAGLIETKLLVEPPWGGGTKSLFMMSGSHDQGGRHAHIL